MLRALRGTLGKSAVEEAYLAGARTLAEQLGDKLVLPEDLLCASSPKADEAIERSPGTISADEMALDIGPKTQRRLSQLIAGAGTALWCGTVGFQKAPAFSGGTRALLNAFRETAAFTMVVGDDSVAAARALCPDALENIDCVAQGGPATLALLDENKLAGLEALRGTNT
jgi:phosphoglycerate kinase